MLFFLFLNYWPIIIILTAIAQIFNPISETVIPIGVLVKEAKTEIEINPIIVETIIGSVQYKLQLYKRFCAFYSSIDFALFLWQNNFLFQPYF